MMSPLLKAHLKSFRQVGRLIQGHPALILAREDWLQFYLRAPQHFMPLTQYYPMGYDSQPIRFVVEEKGFEKETAAYLTLFPSLTEKLHAVPAQCQKIVADRFVVSDLRCLT